MMCKRFFSYVALALCACFGSSFASAMERPISYLVSAFDSVGELHSSAMARMELTLASWRTGSETGSDSLSPTCAPKAITSSWCRRFRPASLTGIFRSLHNEAWIER